MLQRCGVAFVFMNAEMADMVPVWCLTFELRRAQRQDARARTGKMYRVPQAGPWWLAVGARLERGVRPHSCHLKA